MKESPLIKKARAIIGSVKGKPQTIEFRSAKSIELAGLMLEESRRIRTKAETKHQEQISGMIGDPIGKAFFSTITDQCFRSRNYARIANQVVYTIKKFGIPSFLPFFKKVQLKLFKAFGNMLPWVMVPAMIRAIQKETNTVILPGEEKPLLNHMEQRRREGVRINLNHLGEAILGEEEALRRLQIYLDDLAKPEVEYISVKISTIYSQINLLAWNDNLDILSERLRMLYTAALNNTYKRPDGKSVPKFVNLDMEEYRDLHLTVALFRQVLDEPEFYQYSAGIVLQAYLPDSFLLQQELTVWAMQRIANGGAPIKIRLVKGANLAMEQFDAALHLWPQAPYQNKDDVDANFKRMVTYASQPDHANAAHIGIGSHNLFDIAYAMLLRSENNIEEMVSFEMLEGMSDNTRRVVQELSGGMLLYCPAALKSEFHTAVAYLVRRLDENTAPDNFLSHSFNLKQETEDWSIQARFFLESCSKEVSFFPSRIQNRLSKIIACSPSNTCFKNEPDTDWSLPQNRKWAEKIIKDWFGKSIDVIPLVIDGQSIVSDVRKGKGVDPSYPEKSLYSFTLADESQVDMALKAAKKAEADWSEKSVQERSTLLATVAQGLRCHRADLIGAMIADTGKTVAEADVEISEAIDFAEYYRHAMEEWFSLEDISWYPKGTVLVAPPWNFPCSIPAGGVIAALAMGNCVILKPASEAVLVGWTLAQVFWEAGISRHVLQFLTCEDDPVGSSLIRDPRINAVVLTGATATAQHFLNLRPGLNLIAETGGKNAVIVTSLADRDLAIKDIIQSAFGHAGQKCSACSLAILEAEVYDDFHFRQQLRDAADSLKRGSPWNLRTRLNPLIQAPTPALWRGLTTLEKGEEWLLEPEQDENNPNLWSPGIKLGVKAGGFTHQNELFGPVLGLMRAKDLDHAIELANGTPYGLTSGLHSLDEREQEKWMKNIKAGNCYINRGITGAIVQRQPFGGCKDSSFGKGAKAGGPNYVIQLANVRRTGLPKERDQEDKHVAMLNQYAHELAEDDQELWCASIESYSYFWKRYFRKDHDPSLVAGQDNIFRYVPHDHVVLRVQSEDAKIDILRVMAAALTTGTPLEVSGDSQWITNLPAGITWFKETEGQFIERLSKHAIKRVRLLQEPSKELCQALAEAACRVHLDPVMANGRVELLNYLREVSISRDYHRYGNLGLREQEHQLPKSGCGGCCPCKKSVK